MGCKPEIVFVRPIAGEDKVITTSDSKAHYNRIPLYRYKSLQKVKAVLAEWGLRCPVCERCCH